MKRLRNGKRRHQPGGGVVIAGIHQQAALKHGLGQFLDKQRHAIRTGEDLLLHIARQRFSNRHLPHQSFTTASA
jgi:hypothetical protein